MRYEDQSLGVWDTATLTESVRFPLAFTNAISFAVAPLGKLVAVGLASGTIELLNPVDQREVAHLDLASQIDLKSAQDLEIAFSRDGKSLAAATGDGKIRVWGVGTQRLLSQTQSQGARGTLHYSPLIFSPDARILGVAYGDGAAAIIHVADGRQLAFVGRHQGPAIGAVLLPDGKTVATAGFDQAVKLWDAQSGAELVTLHGEALACFALALSPDGRRLAVGGAEGVARIWDPATRQLVALLKAPPRDDFEGLAFSDDGNTLVALTTTTLRFWRAASWAEIEAAEK
jgi:WD40 repeat protein